MKTSSPRTAVRIRAAYPLHMEVGCAFSTLAPRLRWHDMHIATSPCNGVDGGLQDDNDAKRLAAELGYDYVSGTGTLARLLGIPGDEDPPRYADIRAEMALRRTDDHDRVLEDELHRLSRARDRQVFNASALPWTSTDPELIRIWIESTPLTRAWKCYVSQGEDRKLELDQCGLFIAEKDAFNRALFLRTLGFDLFTSCEVFDIVLDNSFPPSSRQPRLRRRRASSASRRSSAAPSTSVTGCCPPLNSTR